MQNFTKIELFPYWQCLCKNKHYTIQIKSFSNKCEKCGSELVWSHNVDSNHKYGLYEHIPILFILHDLDDPDKDEFIVPNIGKAELITDINSVPIWQFTLNGISNTDKDFYIAKAKCIGSNRTNKSNRNMLLFLDENRVIKNGYGLFNFISFDPELVVMYDI